MNIPIKSPSHTTLINWIHKIGYYELTKPKQKASDWIIIPDESIQLGHEKVLVIYGIQERVVDFTRPLQFNDLEPLVIVARKSFNGEIIKEIISELKESLGTIKYAVGDHGSAIRKALRLLQIPHIHDLTHKIALIIEKIYKDKKEYGEITHQMSEMRIQFSQTKNADIIPPKQRKKSRYLNIKTISDWCMKMVQYTKKNTHDRVYQAIKWLLPYKQFVEELSQINTIICKVEKELKHYGFSKITKNKCLKILKTLNSECGNIIRNELSEYFKEIKTILPETKTCLITSDIIESAFGKYKNYTSLNPMAGITNLTLCIAAFTSSLEISDIKNILENIKINDIKKWTYDNIGTTIIQRRKAILSKG